MLKTFLLSLLVGVAAYAVPPMPPAFAADDAAAVHLIEPAQAKAMIARFQTAQVAVVNRAGQRIQAEASVNPTPTSHAFNAAALRALVANHAVKTIRVYYALTEDGSPALVIAGETEGGEPVTYLDRSRPCPPYCVVVPPVEP